MPELDYKFKFGEITPLNLPEEFHEKDSEYENLMDWLLYYNEFGSFEFTYDKPYDSELVIPYINNKNEKKEAVINVEIEKIIVNKEETIFRIIFYDEDKNILYKMYHNDYSTPTYVNPHPTNKNKYIFYFKLNNYFTFYEQQEFEIIVKEKHHEEKSNKKLKTKQNLIVCKKCNKIKKN